jgi:hypothetical protein
MRLKNSVFLFYLLIFTQLINSQTKISGIIYNNEKVPISRANIQLLDIDSTNIDFKFSDNDGKYKIFAQEKRLYLLKISAFNYQTQIKKILIDKDLIENFILENKISTLETVIIKSQSKSAKFRGDSISYNIKSVIDSTERNLGDLLKKLPGLEIDDNGKVKFQGNKIEKILIDGNDFYGNKHQMATENITPDMIEGIDLLLKHQTNNNLKDFNNETKTVLNVKLKEKYRGEIIGNIAFYGGIENKYLGHSNLFKFSKKGNISWISDINNIGDSPMSVQDYIELIGGTNSLLSNTETNSSGLTDIDEFIPKYIYTENKVKKKENYFSALNYTYRFSKKIKISGNTLINKTNQLESLSTQRFFILQSSSSIIDELKQNNSRSNISSSNLNIEFNPNNKTNITYSLSYNPTEGKSNETIVNFKNNFYNNTINRSFNFGHLLKITQRISENLLFKFNINHTDSKIENNFNIKSNNSFLGLQFSNNDYYVLKSSSFYNSKLGVNSSMILKNEKDIYTIAFSYNFLNESLNTSINNNIIDYGNYLNNLSTKTADSKSGIKVENYISKIILKYGISLNTLNIKTKDEILNVLNFEPNFGVNYDISSVNKIGLSYSKTNKKPSLFQTLKNSMVDDYQTLFTQSEVQLSQYSPTDNYSLNFNNYKSKQQQFITLNLNYSSSKNVFTTNSIYSDFYSTMNYLTSPRETSINSILLFERKFNFIPITFKTSFTFSQTNGISNINNDENHFVNSHHLFVFKIHSDFKKSKIQFQINYLIDNFQTIQQINNLSVKTVNQEIKFNLLGYFKKTQFNLCSSVLKQKSETNNQLQIILSPNFSYFSKNNKWEFDIKTQNILHLNKNLYLSQLNTNYYVEYSQQNIITGNILLGLKYNL